MAEVSLQALHAVTVEMHGGMLTLAAVCIVIKVIDLAYLRFLPGKFPRLYARFAPLSALAGPAALLAAIGGIFGLAASAVTGYLLVPGSTLTDDPLGMNKVMVSVFAIYLWSIFVVLAVRNRGLIWKSRRFSVIATGVALAGYASSIVGGSLGGTMAGKGSILDPVWELLGVDLHASWIMGLDLVFIVAIAVNVLMAVVIISSLRAGRAKAPVKETSQ